MSNLIKTNRSNYLDSNKFLQSTNNQNWTEDDRNKMQTQVLIVVYNLSEQMNTLEQLIGLF